MTQEEIDELASGSGDSGEIIVSGLLPSNAASSVLTPSLEANLAFVDRAFEARTNELVE